MKNFSFIVTLLLFSLISCNLQGDEDLTPFEKRKPTNVIDREYIIYVGGAHCPDGPPYLTTIFAQTDAECQCLLNEFINDCPEAYCISECSPEPSDSLPILSDCGSF